MPSPDEVESYLLIQDCLELRKRYLYRETVAPWVKEEISDPSTPKANPDPFLYSPERKSGVSIFKLVDTCNILTFNNSSLSVELFGQHYFEMQDGVVHVYPNKECEDLSLYRLKPDFANLYVRIR